MRIQTQRHPIVTTLRREPTTLSAPQQAGPETEPSPGLASGLVQGGILGGAAGVSASILVTGAAALYAAASGDSVSLSELGSGFLEVASLTAPNSAIAGALAGATAAALGSNASHVRSTAMVTGAVAGSATLGFAVYEVIQTLRDGLM